MGLLLGRSGLRWEVLKSNFETGVSGNGPFFSVWAPFLCLFNATLPDHSTSYCADAEVSVRGSGSGNHRTQVRQTSV